MKIVKIECPGCGSKLTAEEGTSRVICDFCGSSVVVEDSKMEGYNQELGKMEARANVSNNLADVILELIAPICDMKNKLSEVSALEKQLNAFKTQDQMFKKGGKYFPYVFASIFTILILLILVAAKAKFGFFIVFDIICILMYPLMGKLVYQYWDNITSSIGSTEAKLLEDKKTIDRYNEVINAHQDIKIPPKYQTPRAMEFISKAVRSQGANTLEHAYSQYDDLLMREKSIALQEEQIRLQKQQINQAKNPQVVVVRQRGHSIIIHLILLSVGIGFITIPYYTLSKHHYWHL